MVHRIEPRLSKPGRCFGDSPDSGPAVRPQPSALVGVERGASDDWRWLVQGRGVWLRARNRFGAAPDLPGSCYGAAPRLGEFVFTSRLLEGSPAASRESAWIADRIGRGVRRRGGLPRQAPKGALPDLPRPKTKVRNWPLAARRRFACLEPLISLTCPIRQTNDMIRPRQSIASILAVLTPCGFRQAAWSGSAVQLLNSYF